MVLLGSSRLDGTSWRIARAEVADFWLGLASGGLVATIVETLINIPYQLEPYHSHSLPS
jgi:hypothetical protein